MYNSKISILFCNKFSNINNKNEMIMQIETTFLHNECPYYFTDNYIGFRIVSPKKGDYYLNKKYAYNTLVFILEGEVEFSYNEYIGKRFKKGDMMFIPQASHMYSVALADTQMLVLTYDLATESYCSNCVLSKIKFDVKGIEEIEYDFQPLKMTPAVFQFAELFKTYIESDIRCMYLHELKQKELFIIMEYAYTHRQQMEFFYPILGEDIKFRNKVLRIAHEQLTVEQYAIQLNMTTRTFARKFKDEFGQTTQQWLLQHKMSQIKLRLSLPSVNISTILHEFKFSDASHFYRFCRTHFGCTSKELIEQLRNKHTHL